MLAAAVVAIFIPPAIGVALFRYHLYDIDRIISRTVAYAIVVAALAAVFITIVTLASLALPTDSGLAVAAGTLAAAALFNPLRVRVQRQVERRFNRTGYEAYLVTDEFASRMQDTHDVEEVATIWVSTIDETLSPSSTALWLRPNY